MSKSPTARSLELLREKGYACQVVEYYHAFSKKRRDLFGCIDIVAAHPKLGLLGVQATSGSNHSARFKKATKCPVGHWLRGGGMLQIWSWSKKADRKWHCRRENVLIADLVEE